MFINCESSEGKAKINDCQDTLYLSYCNLFPWKCKDQWKEKKLERPFDFILESYLWKEQKEWLSGIPLFKWNAKLTPETLLNVPKSLQSNIIQSCKARRRIFFFLFFSPHKFFALVSSPGRIQYIWKLKAGLFLYWKHHLLSICENSVLLLQCWPFCVSK